MSALAARSSRTAAARRAELPRQRRRRRPGCPDRLICAPLWPRYGVNLGTLLRTCDAVGACLAVPLLGWVPRALEHGSRLPPDAVCVHWMRDRQQWLQKQKATAEIIGAELAGEAVRLAALQPATRKTVLLLGNEQSGIPPEAAEYMDFAVEIPMNGTGGSLNVAVAGSLVLYRLAGLS
jgi:tRNA (guanosine-2'-O-)-methyltransferase